MNKYYKITIVLFLIISCSNKQDNFPRTLWGGVKPIKESNYSSDVWVIGDSYLSEGPPRWPFYIAISDSGGKILFDYKAGARSDLMFSYFEEDLKHGTPHYLIWALGMNDNTHFEMPTIGFYLWKYYYNKVQGICKKKKIQLIVCTIPNVPIRDNSKKNEYIRHNLKNYIDFDSLVTNGVDKSWKRGWLEANGKGVHPTELGARNMGSYFKKRFSEITKYAY